jgi:enoyl-CoA hydratase/carnithine racemase
MSEAPRVLYTVEADGVATLILNRPEKRNAFDSEMIDAWLGALDAFAADPDAKVMILTGAGTAFCAGGDTGAMESRGKLSALEQKDYLWRNVHRIPLAMSRLDKPVIAAVNGNARGAGLDMALYCDMVLMAESATVAESYIDIGLPAGDGGAWLLPRLVGMQQALNLLLTGRVIESREAERLGLVLKTVPDDSLMREAVMLARTIAAKSGPAVRLMKRLAYQSVGLPLATHFDMVSSHMAVLKDGDDHRQRIAAMNRRRT